MYSLRDLKDISTIALMVEDPGAVNFLAPLVDHFIKESVPVIIYGVGVGASQFRARGHVVHPPPCRKEALIQFKLLHFSMLITGTSEDPQSPAFDLLKAARAAQIPTIGVVDASVNAPYRFRGITQDPLAHAPDWLMVPDEVTFREFKTLGFDPGKICIVANPARELARKRGREIRSKYLTGLRKHQCNKLVKRLIFVAELSDGLNPMQYSRSASYTLTGRGESQSRTMIVAEELLDGYTLLNHMFGLNVTMVLRLHPKQPPDDLGLLCEEFDEVSQGGDPLELVATADLAVGMSSMLLLQALDIGVPCLAILPRKEEISWLPEIAAGLIPVALTRQEVNEHLLQLLSIPPLGELDNMNHRTIQEFEDPITAMMRFLTFVSKATNR